MSIILSWENPPETFLPLIHRAEVWRSAPNSNQRLFKIASDAPWGVFEDTEGIDPTAKYRVDYLNGHNGHVASIRNEDIRRMVRPADLARLIFDFRDPNGFPSAGKTIEISNEPIGDDFYARVVTNHAGHAEFFAPYNQRLQIKIDGWPKLLDCVVPAQRDVRFDELQKNGSILPVDSRGLV